MNAARRSKDMKIDLDDVKIESQQDHLTSGCYYRFTHEPTKVSITDLRSWADAFKERPFEYRDRMFKMLQDKVNAMVNVEEDA